MEKEIYCNCGEKLSENRYSFSDGDGAFIVPVMFAKTIKDVAKFYKEETGGDYFEDTGVKPEKDFYRTMVKLTHIDPDDDGYEEMKKHSYGEVECWSNA